MDLDVFLKQQVVPSKQHNYFYHFTDKENLPLIQQHGLLSMQQIRQRGLKVPAPGGNDWSWDADKRSGMDGYVHLCFTKGHPMAYKCQKDGRIKDIVFLKIAPQIIKVRGVMITGDVSNKRGVTPGLASPMLDSLDLEVIYKRLEWKDRAVKARLDAADKYELLVPAHVPLDVIVI